MIGERLSSETPPVVSTPLFFLLPLPPPPSSSVSQRVWKSMPFEQITGNLKCDNI